MSGGHHIRAIGADGDDKGTSAEVEVADEATVTPEIDDDTAWDEDWEEPRSSFGTGWVFPTFAGLVIAAWTGMSLSLPSK